jgi:hypothetical protein
MFTNEILISYNHDEKTHMNTFSHFLLTYIFYVSNMHNYYSHEILKKV